MSHPTDNLLRERSLPGAVELRAADDDGQERLYGHFAVFDEWTEIDSWYEGRFRERIAPGAFADTFVDRRDSIRVLYDHGHDPSVGNKPLGIPTTLSEDARGAYYEVDLFDADYVNELKPAIRAGQMGASFRFRVTAEEWAEADDMPERTITGVELYEFGPVTFPAYASATAGLRSRTDEFFDRMLTEPTFVARMTDRLGLKVVEQMIASLPADGRSQTPTEEPADGRNEVIPHTPPAKGRLVVAALADLKRRQK